MPKASRKRPKRPGEQERPSAAERGYDHRWQSARASFLKMNPLCMDHLTKGAFVPATVVDHHRPHKGDYDLFWDERNWRALCKRCHDRKTVLSDGGLGRATRTETYTDCA